MPNSGSTRSTFSGDTRGSPGARRRPAAGAGAAAEGGGATANGGSSTATNNGAGGGGGGSGRAYTEEQERAVKKVICFCRGRCKRVSISRCEMEIFFAVRFLRLFVSRFASLVLRRPQARVAADNLSQWGTVQTHVDMTSWMISLEILRRR